MYSQYLKPCEYVVSNQAWLCFFEVAEINFPYTMKFVENKYP